MVRIAPAPTALEPVHAALRASTRANTVSIHVMEIIEKFQCRKIKLKVMDGTTEVALVRYVHIIPSVSAGNTINLPSGTTGAEALALTRVGRIAYAQGDSNPTNADLEDSCGHRGNTGAHLHQSARPSGSGDTHVFYNKDNGAIDSNRHLTGEGYPSGNISPPYPVFCSDAFLFKIASSTPAATSSEVRPCAPTGLTGARSDSRLTMTWDNPNDPTVASHEIRHKLASGSWPTPEVWTAVTPTTSHTHTITGLGSGQAHDVEVRARVNAGGISGLRSPATTFSDWPAAACTGTVAATVSPVGSGTVTAGMTTVPSSGVALPCGSSALIAEPTANYTFSSWSSCPSGGTSGAMCTVTVAKTHTARAPLAISATFRQKNCTVTGNVKTLDSANNLLTTAGGRIRANSQTGASATVPCGNDVMLTKVAFTGYSFDRWEGCTSLSTNKEVCTVATSGLSKAAYATAIFKQDHPQCSVTVAADPGGSATNRGTKSGDCPVPVTTTAIPNTAKGYTFNRWSGDSSSTSDTITVTATASSPTKSVTATFTPPQCSVTVAADPGGSATNRGTKSSDCPVSVPTTAIPDAEMGYTFNRWSGDSNSTSRTITVTATASTPIKSVTATFTPPQCSLSVTDGTGGSAEITSGGATGDCGRSVTIRATADDNYRFSGWSGDVSGAQSPKTVTVNKTSMSAHASFKEQCTVVAAGSTGGTASGGDTVDCGKTVTLRATAKAGYCFSYWQQLLPPEEFARQTTSSSCPATGSISVKTSSGNAIYQAVFRAKRSYTLSVSVVPRGAGSVPGAGSYTEGTPVTLTAKAVAPYYLKAWSGCDSSSGTTCKVTMNRNRTVTASFDNLCESVPGLCARTESE